ncbi:WD40-repeat-containing_domain superfamily [Hexamita inflata]|uniref:WD40-repeat-containing domain superfamily n=1 Tax=Hexamita inflata TaxID=28002 RepID=A0AA86NV19_9EUKA|nr:WD40-repeat-containing domain superfamily [Hexamita inflata]CAI9926513.1 WD40-repeat-containing domain superfamily [Hexamita inflata]
MISSHLLNLVQSLQQPYINMQNRVKRLNFDISLDSVLMLIENKLFILEFKQFTILDLKTHKLLAIKVPQANSYISQILKVDSGYLVISKDKNVMLFSPEFVFRSKFGCILSAPYVSVISTQYFCASFNSQVNIYSYLERDPLITIIFDQQVTSTIIDLNPSILYVLSSSGFCIVDLNSISTQITKRSFYETFVQVLNPIQIFRVNHTLLIISQFSAHIYNLNSHSFEAEIQFADQIKLFWNKQFVLSNGETILTSEKLEILERGEIGEKVRNAVNGFFVTDNGLFQFK